jgi:hypothetical protein
MSLPESAILLIQKLTEEAKRHAVELEQMRTEITRINKEIDELRNHRKDSDSHER